MLGLVLAYKSDVNCIKFDNVALQSNRNYLPSDCGNHPLAASSAHHYGSDGVGQTQQIT